MKKIFKYRLPRDGEAITINAHVIKWLEIHEQHSWPHIWAIVDDAKPSNDWTIIAWGTGWDVPEEIMAAEYLGTAEDGAGYVWHYFGEAAAPSYATAVTQYDYNPYDYTLTTKGSPITPYSVTISCGDVDGLSSNSADVNYALQSVINSVTSSGTASTSVHT